MTSRSTLQGMLGALSFRDIAIDEEHREKHEPGGYQTAARDGRHRNRGSVLRHLRAPCQPILLLCLHLDDDFPDAVHLILALAGSNSPHAGVEALVSAQPDGFVEFGEIVHDAGLHGRQAPPLAHIGSDQVSELGELVIDEAHGFMIRIEISFLARQDESPFSRCASFRRE